jgi:hypothetical protein
MAPAIKAWLSMNEQIEYHCPDCQSITPVMPGVTQCLGCGRLLTLIEYKSGGEEGFWLYTRDGRKVTRVTMPLFNPSPEVILWGERYFVLRDDGEYYECMVWPILPA